MIIAPNNAVTKIKQDQSWTHNRCPISLTHKQGMGVFFGDLGTKIDYIEMVLHLTVSDGDVVY